MPGAVAADGQKAPVALRIRIARQVHCISGSAGGYLIDFQPAFAQALQRRTRQFRGTSSAGCRVHDGKKSFHAGLFSPEN